MTYTIQFSNIAGDRHIAASGFFIIQNEVCDGDIWLLLGIGYVI